MLSSFWEFSLNSKVCCLFKMLLVFSSMPLLLIKSLLLPLIIFKCRWAIACWCGGRWGCCSNPCLVKWKLLLLVRFVITFSLITDFEILNDWGGGWEDWTGGVRRSLGFSSLLLSLLLDEWSLDFASCCAFRDLFHFMRRFWNQIFTCKEIKFES